jgi:hypothetical protein
MTGKIILDATIKKLYTPPTARRNHSTESLKTKGIFQDKAFKIDDSHVTKKKLKLATHEQIATDPRLFKALERQYKASQLDPNVKKATQFCMEMMKQDLFSDK